METNANQKVSCVVNYAYEASEPDELTIRPGDILRDVERLPGGWWRGELRGRRGMFPDNFVSLTTDRENNASTRSAGVQGRCRAVFTYQPANPDELPLCVGDVLDVLGEVEEGWWQGRRQGRVGVFPSNFVVMLDGQPVVAADPAPAPALPPKPVKEQCRVLFPYTAVNDDELTLLEGEIVTIVSKDAPDRGWWRGELQGRVGLFPDNFVQLLPVTQDVEEKKPERPISKSTNVVYPILNKYSEKTASLKELTTSKITLHKENTLTKEITSPSTITHTNKTESEKIIHNESVSDGVDGQVKKPPVPLKKSPTPATTVSGLFSGLKSKMLSSNDKTEKIAASSGSSSGEWERSERTERTERTDRTDGAASTKQSYTFDHIERNSILNDPRAGRVKAPRRRPPSQAPRDDSPQQLGLSNGHEAERPPAPTTSPPTDIAPHVEEIKPRAREWEKHKAPWMAELKLNQAKKTTFGTDGKQRSLGGETARAAATGSTDRIVDCGLEDKRASHSMEMSKSTSSISSRISLMESFDEKPSTPSRHSLDAKKEAPPLPTSEPPPATLHSPTAAGRTLSMMLDDIKKPPAPSPPLASIRTHNETTTPVTDKTNNEKTVTKTETQNEVTKRSGTVYDKSVTVERIEKVEERPASVGDKMNTIERRLQSLKADKGDANNVEALVAHLNTRISNLEKLIEVQDAKFTATIEKLNSKLAMETEKRMALQAEMEKLAHCVTQV